jgi:tetratricopeptide (TPR) repeat protein
LLGPQDQQQADRLAEQRNRALEEQKWDQAVEAATALSQLRDKVQGADHWEAGDARRELQTLRRLASATPEDQQGYVRAAQQERLAAALEQKRQARQAQPLWQEVLDLRRKILGEEHLDTATAYYNLGGNQKAQGKYAEAEQGYRKALAIYRKLLSEEHPATATAYSGLASNQNARGKYTEAEPGYRKALDLYRKLLGEEHLDTATAYSNLAVNQGAQGKYAEAEPGFRKALDLRRKLLGEDHPATASAYDSLAGNQQYQGKYAEAEEGFRKSLDLRRKLLGENHPHTALAYNNLASNQQYQGKYAEAEAGLRKALDLGRKLLGDEHPDTATTYYNLAFNQRAQGKYAEAEQGFRKALDLLRKLQGEDHPATALVYDSLAGNQGAQGKYAEAEQGFRKALDLRRKLLGEDHPHTATSYSGLAFNQNAQRKYVEAEQGFRKALDLYRKLLGDEHPLTANAYNDLAGNQQSQGKYAEAEPGFRKALDLKRKLLGKEHPDIAVAYNNLASSQNAQGKYVEAEEGFRKALDLCRKLLGEDHPDIATACSNLAGNQHAQGKYAEAEILYARAAEGARLGRSLRGASGLERTMADGNLTWMVGLPALLARNGKPETAWQRYEETLGRGSKDDLAVRLRYSAADQQRLSQLQVRWQRLEQQLLPLLTLDRPDPAQQQLRDTLLADKLRIQKDLDEHQRHLEAIYGPIAGRTDSWQALQAALPADTALLGWVDVRGEAKAADPSGEHWAFLLRSAGPPLCVRLPGSSPGQAWSAADDALPGRLFQALRDPQLDWRPLARSLRQQRLAPLEKHLVGVRRLVVLPLGALDGIPVEVLAEGYAVSYALSGTYFAHLRRQPRADSQGLLALGDPVFRQTDAPRQSLPEHGLLITFVAPQSNAAQAELRSGDVLLRYNGTDLRRPDDLALVASGDNPKARVPVRVWRLDREGATPVARTLELTVRPGPLGVTLAKEPAPVALDRRRRIEAEVAQRGGEDWAELPGTRYEVERVAALFRQEKVPVQVLLDSAASEQSLDELHQSGALSHCRYLHLATHGISDRRFLFRSRLQLARDRLPDAAQQLAAGLPPFDGELTAGKILQHWHLKADLVTLSACETARGQLELSEGQVGFAQTLLLAGARSVVLSQWKVDDSATALLMERFYQNLLGRRDGLAKPLPKAEALDEARRWLRSLSRTEVLQRVAALSQGISRGKDRPALPRLPEPPRPAEGQADAPFAHPSYWAAFVLYGDPD